MNIFALDSSPIISAQYHCDQHLHKMILESAQMLSTVVYLCYKPSEFPPNLLYNPAYPKHPCTKWICKSPDNTLWLCALALELEAIRSNLDLVEHSSTKVIKAIADYVQELYPAAIYSMAHPRTFAGPAIINIRPWTTEEKYRNYYRSKHQAWTLDKGAGMSYKGRPVPDFMADLLHPPA